MAPAGRHDGQTQLVWAPLVATCQIDGGRPQLLLLYIVDDVMLRMEAGRSLSHDPWENRIDGCGDDNTFPIGRAFLVS